MKVKVALSSLSTVLLLAQSPAHAVSNISPQPSWLSGLGGQVLSVLGSCLGQENLGQCIIQNFGDVLSQGFLPSNRPNLFGNGNPLSPSAARMARTQATLINNRQGASQRSANKILSDLFGHSVEQGKQKRALQNTVSKSNEAVQRISDRVQGLQGSGQGQGQGQEPGLVETVKTNVSTLESLAKQAESIANQSYTSSQEILKQILVVSSLQSQQNVALGEIAKAVHQQMQVSNESLKDIAEVAAQQNEALQAMNEMAGDFYARLLDAQGQQEMVLQQILGKLPDLSTPVTENAPPSTLATTMGSNIDPRLRCQRYQGAQRTECENSAVRIRRPQ